MRTLSRHMPAADAPASTMPQKVIGIVVLVAFAFFVLVVPYLILRTLTSEIVLLLCFGAIMVPAYLIAFHRQETAFDKLMAPRANENICTFRKAFDLHRVDPWVVRAVHEEVLNAIMVGLGKSSRAIRASDRLVEDLFIDDEELGDIAEIIANRAGYDVADASNNPLYGKVVSVGDLVMFFTHQRCVRA